MLCTRSPGSRLRSLAWATSSARAEPAFESGAAATIGANEPHASKRTPRTQERTLYPRRSRLHGGSIAPWAGHRRTSAPYGGFRLVITPWRHVVRGVAALAIAVGIVLVGLHRDQQVSPRAAIPPSAGVFSRSRRRSAMRKSFHGSSGRPPDSSSGSGIVIDSRGDAILIASSADGRVVADLDRAATRDERSTRQRWSPGRDRESATSRSPTAGPAPVRSGTFASHGRPTPARRGLSPPTTWIRQVAPLIPRSPGDPAGQCSWHGWTRAASAARSIFTPVALRIGGNLGIRSPHDGPPHR